jgi:hypothetical protein
VEKQIFVYHQILSMRATFTLLLLLAISLAVCLPADEAKAQQDPIYAQYLMNPMIINPSYAGINNNMQVNVGYRIQWMGLEASPKTLNFNGAVSIIDNKAVLSISMKDR